MTTVSELNTQMKAALAVRPFQPLGYVSLNLDTMMICGLTREAGDCHPDHSVVSIALLPR